jgi:uncharacterized protein YajQ (UPF0234 family)
MASPETPPRQQEDIVLPAATRTFILQALDETSSALARTHGLRATHRLLVEEGIRLTQDNSYRIDNLNNLLLMNLIRRMLEPECRAAGKGDVRVSP